MSAYTQTAYPFFRKGQVLKNTDLNNMVDYLDQHNRFTRVLVVGSGIFSGLEVDLVLEGSEYTIKVSQGFGLSSDGFIIQLKKEVPNIPFEFTHYRKLTLSDNDFKCKKPDGPDLPEPVSFDAYELLEDIDENADTTGVAPLYSLPENLETNTHFCLVLWVSREEKDRPYCIDICDESGADLNFTIKPLLVPSDIFNTADQNGSGESTANGFIAPPQVKLRPFGYQVSSVNNPITGSQEDISVVNPSLVEDHNDFLENYKSIIHKLINQEYTISDAYDWAYKHMQWLGLEGDENPFADLKANLNSLLETFSAPLINEDGSSQNIEIQYLYSYLHDLLGAYEEFVKMACSLQTAVLPLVCKHVRYVGLAGFAVDVEGRAINEEDSNCRTAFQSSLFYEGNNSRIQETEFYFKRMVKLATDLTMVDLPLTKAAPEDIANIIVTPGRTPSLPLSKQAFPYYYNNDSKKYWSYHTKMDCFDPKILGYRDHTIDTLFTENNPLLQHDDEFTFYRVEGHVGKQADEVYDAMNFWVNQFNLPFDVQFVNLLSFDNDLIGYYAPELEILQSKYSQVKTDLIGYLMENDFPVPGEDVLPEKLEYFLCKALSQWLNSLNNFDVPLNVDCFIAAFWALQLHFEMESETFRYVNSFHEFALQHPGLLHKGGAPAGGTLVIVNAVVPNAFARDLVIQLEKEKRSGSTSGNQSSVKIIPDESIRAPQGSKPLGDPGGRGSFKSPPTKDPDARSFTGLEKRFREMLSENATQVVVGDFCLPYRCCNSLKTPEPMIYLLPDEFCSNDEKIYEIWTYPRGGTIRGVVNGEIPDTGDLPDYISFDDAQRKYFFHPVQVPLSNEISAEVVITYHIGSLTAKSKLMVYNKPGLPEMNVGENVPIYDSQSVLHAQEITFTIENNNDSYASYWMVDGERVEPLAGTPANILKKTFYYHNKTQYVVSHVFGNGICETKTDEIINLCEMVDTVTISIGGEKTFTENPQEDESLDLDVSPMGGKFLLKKADGDAFEPNIEITTEPESNNIPSSYKLINTNLNPLPHGQYTLSYYLPFCGKVASEDKFDVLCNPSIILKRYVFCSNDKHRYPIYLHPANGTLLAEPNLGLIKDSDQYFFEPSQVTIFEDDQIAIIELSCDPPNGEKVTQTLTVYKVPNEIEIIDSKPVYNAGKLCEGGYLYRFKAGDGRADRYEWQVNDETKAVYEHNAAFEYIFPLSKAIVVKLIVEATTETGDPKNPKDQTLTCRNEIIHDIKDLCPTETLSIVVENYGDEHGQYLIEVSPPGGSFSLVLVESGFVIKDLPLTMSGQASCEDAKFLLRVWDIEEFNKLKVSVFKIVYSFPKCDLFVESDFIFLDEPGESRILETRGPSENPATNPGLIPEKSEDLTQLLNIRFAANQATIEELEKDSSLAKTKTFGMAKMFSLFAGDTREMNKRFATASGLLMVSLKKATGDRKSQYEKLLEAITYKYLDKVVTSSPEKLTDEVRELLEDLNSKMEAAGIKKKRMVKNWKAEDLKKVLKTSSANAIKNIFK